MKNVFGNNLTVTLYGESHGKSIGAVIDGLCPGLPIDEGFIRSRLDLRRPSGLISTSRREPDPFEIESGCFMGRATGTPLSIRIPNSDTRSSSYDDISHIARPGHADYTAYVKYGGFADYRGGGHFSGRITAALVAAGAIAQKALMDKGIYIGTHIKRCAGVSDRDFGDIKADIDTLMYKDLAVLDDSCTDEMISRILKAREEKDSVGGVLETAVVGMPAGVGEPWFDTLESVLSHALFSVPAVKGVEFGDGFALADMRGSEANDAFRVQDGKVCTATNHNGGINGGITNGMPVVFRCAVKPTPSISQVQDSVDFRKNEDAPIEISGRHDPCIVHRARVVVDSITALTLYDMLATRFGTDWFIKKWNTDL